MGSLATKIAGMLLSGERASVPTLVPWAWGDVCAALSGIPYVWGVSDCSRQFWTVSVLAGYFSGERGNTDSMLGYPQVDKPYDGVAVLFGVPGDARHVARVVQTASGLQLWHAHGGGSANTASNPGGPAGFSPLDYDAKSRLGYYVVVPEVVPGVGQLLGRLDRSDWVTWRDTLERYRVLPGKVR